MTANIEVKQSLPEYFLCQEGSSVTYTELLRALQDVSDKDLEALDDDIDFYLQTGLVGVHMSRLIPCLSVSSSEKAGVVASSRNQSNVVDYLDWKRRAVVKAA